MAQEEEIIKSAVSQPAVQEEEMQASMMQQEVPQEGQEQYAPYPREYQDQQYSQQGYDQSYGYAAPSTDTITEISEQIVSEKVSKLKADIEKFAEFKNITETKIDLLDQRLKRIESTIDKLQLSILQRVGQYVNDISDLKSEVIETQKSFKSLLDKKG
jgi:myosin heavy subunit